MTSNPTSANKPGLTPPADGADVPCDFKPILLEDLLCGLPPIAEDDEFAALAAEAEPALLLTEVAEPSPATSGGWAAETEKAEPSPTLVEAPGGPGLVEELRAADPGAAMEAVAAIADAAAAAEHDDVLELTEDLIAEPEPEPEPEPEAEAQPAPPPEGAADPLLQRIGAILADAPAKGDVALPDDRDALAVLLSDPPPANDFAALDALYACWPRGTQNSESRALLAAAQNLSHFFGLPGKLPMASSKAWRMLSPQVFEDELAHRLTEIGRFIADWQKTQRTFLILEFNEIELIEYLFEALDPATHAELLAGVMNFKVLSNRRMGLLRRIPTRVRKQIQPVPPDRKEEALVILAHAKALLERIAEPTGFAPIVDTATKMAEEMDKIMKSVAAQGAPAIAPPPPGGGMALGRMG